jgi:hypothetical protein
MRATIERDATTAIAQLRKHRSTTLGDVLANWPIKEGQTEEPPAAATSLSRRRQRRRSDRADGDLPHAVRRVKTPLRQRGLRDS